MKKKMFLWALAGALALGTVACGNSGSGSSASSKASSSNEAASKSSKSEEMKNMSDFTASGKVLNIGVQSSVISVPVVYAESKGYYKDLGLRRDLSRVFSSKIRWLHPSGNHYKPPIFCVIAAG
ncbi:MAG: hypothetical protein ACOYBH_06005 [Candidatus Alectryocaccobium sp.]|nr:hypothetical protein [Lachnospiraceae bacterium]MDY6221099.1 hypothetical protein [Candidatus Alectryocaccobium sp.]